VSIQSSEDSITSIRWQPSKPFSRPDYNFSGPQAESLQQSDISAEVLDLRTLKPLDAEGILASVRKARRALVVHEAAGSCGVGAEVAAIIAERAHDSLKAGVLRVTGPDAPPPASFPLEHAYVPNAKRIAEAVRRQVAADLWWALF
jgi:acetoin:2,6-dichlorophenolindophenol oxidoreductase subunit beta